MKRQWKTYILKFFLLTGMLIFDVIVLHYDLINPLFYQLDYGYVENESFRKMKFSEMDIIKMIRLSDQSNLPFGEIMTLFQLVREGKMTSSGITESEFHMMQAILNDLYYSEYHKVVNYMTAINEDILCFPLIIPEHSQYNIHFSDSWGEKRTYGGVRSHEGCDLFPSDTRSLAGIFPVVSMSDGVVENIGWLPLGGYRVGVRSKHNVYFYYAHLDRYVSGLSQGQIIHAGQVIGYMGDTGYSDIEGTTGNFPVHLHVGIYLKTDHMEEMSVNPYPWLVYAREKQIITGQFPLQKQN